MLGRVKERIEICVLPFADFNAFGRFCEEEMVGRGATSVGELRAQAAAIPPAPEFAISAWIRSANSIVANANAKLALPDDHAAEEAFLGFKQAAE